MADSEAWDVEGSEAGMVALGVVSEEATPDVVATEVVGVVMVVRLLALSMKVLRQVLRLQYRTLSRTSLHLEEK